MKTEEKVRQIRSKLSRIGIPEKELDDEALLERYDLNRNGQLRGVIK
jgi:hypothetical protein